MNNQKTMQQIAESFGINMLNDAELISGRFVRVKFYPVTDYKPFRAYAIWDDFEGKQVRVRIQSDLEMNSDRQTIAIEASAAFIKWLGDWNEKIGTYPAGEFHPVLNSVAFAYDGASDSEHALIVTWKDARGIDPARYDAKAAMLKEFESSWVRIDSDMNGNPRYYIPQFLIEDQSKARDCGLHMYRGKKFGAGYVIQSYNIKSTSERVFNATRKG